VTKSTARSTESTEVVDFVDRAVDSVDFNKIEVDFVASVYEALVQTLSL